MARNVAVVIGVGSPTDFTALPGATRGAQDFFHWATTQSVEPYEGTLFTDLAGPVTSASVLDCIKKLTDGTVGRLLLYFAGHGVSVRLNEDYWILSDGHDTPSELVDVRRSLDNARAFSCIPYIAVFADACRTLANRRTTQNAANASTVFPTGDVITDTKLDRFYATKSWEVAREANPGKSEADVATSMIGANGYFTDLLVRALQGGKPEALSVSNASGNVVVSPRRLELYLRTELPLLTGQYVLVSQVPDIDVVSEDPHYIANIRPATLVNLTFEAHLPDDALADKASIKLLRVNDLYDMAVLASSDNGVVSLAVPEGKTYGAEASLDGFAQHPDKPLPLAFPPKTDGNRLVVPLLARPGAGTSGLPPGYEPTPPPRQAGQAASLIDNYAVDAVGAVHPTAPTAGVYTVVTEDVLTGRIASELQVLNAGDKPVPTTPIHADPEVERRIDSDVRTVVESRRVRSHFETQMGLVVVGADVIRAFAPDGAVDQPERTMTPDGLLYAVRGHEPGSVVLQFGDEQYAGLPILPGFIGAVNVGANGVRSLSYTPTTNSDLYAGEEAREFVRVRALAEAAVRTGRIDLLRDQARPFASSVRLYKHVDPVLGVLAAYAYHQVRDLGAIESMIAAFRDVNRFVPFDLVMLAGGDPGSEIDVLPAFPMLAQGWELLGPDGFIPPVLSRARAQLAPALWTTVWGPAGQELGEALAVPGGIWQPQVA
jgi:hypothetical protein